MKTVLCISGSPSADSSNTQLLEAITQSFANSFAFKILDGLQDLPLFSPQLQQAGIPEIVKTLRAKVAMTDAVIICTPEYLHNIPAALKNALEWMTESGELCEKPVLPITFTPAPPRGEYAMRSLVQSLQASKARIVADLPLYRNEMTDKKGRIALDEPYRHIIQEAMGLL
jgi:NAD(P)H-dependent FMN reductase